MYETYLHLLEYLANSAESEKCVRQGVQKKIKEHILLSNFFPKIVNFVR